MLIHRSYQLSSAKNPKHLHNPSIPQTPILLPRFLQSLSQKRTPRSQTEKNFSEFLSCTSKSASESTVEIFS